MRVGRLAARQVKINDLLENDESISTNTTTITIKRVSDVYDRRWQLKRREGAAKGKIPMPLSAELLPKPNS